MLFFEVGVTMLKSRKKSVTTKLQGEWRLNLKILGVDSLCQKKNFMVTPFSKQLLFGVTAPQSLEKTLFFNIVATLTGEIR